MQTKSSWPRIPIASILLGGEGGIAAAEYARLSNAFLRPSTPAANSPHLQFLQTYGKLGSKLFESSTFKQTSYFLNAATCIRITGHYFEAEQDADIEIVARRFVQREFYRDRSVPTEVAAGHSPLGQPVIVQPIAHSRKFQLVDGSHRLAGEVYRGAEDVEAAVLPEIVLTPAQQLLLDVRWQGGRPELYQPVGLPEVASWPAVRRCIDRLFKMETFLRDRGVMDGRYVDLGCSYGWFPWQMSQRGFASMGLDEDARALEIGKQIYGAHCVEFVAGTLPDCLQRIQPADVVSMFSVLHHFRLGRANCSAEELVSSVDALTKKVLFLDSGETHEEWFGHLQDWDPDGIERWLKENTSFSSILRLGKDLDNVPPFQANYGRTMFACIR